MFNNGNSSVRRNKVSNEDVEIKGGKRFACGDSLQRRH